MTTYESLMNAVNSTFLPTEEQRAVIVSESPVMLVIAGAGSGKTATMANRIAYHVGSGKVAPDQVLGLTFTRKAAGELAARVDRTLAKVMKASGTREDLRRPQISTYNSFASEIASTYGLLVGADPSARLITDAERWQLMRDAVKQCAAFEDLADITNINTLVEISLEMAANIIDNGKSVDDVRSFLSTEIAAWERLMETPQKKKDHGEKAAAGWKKLREVKLSSRELCLAVVERYMEIKKERGLTEFADQVSVARRVVTQYPEIADEISGRYAMVLLDEYQDTSVGQAEFLVAALGRTTANRRSVCAVGDPNQAIYGWRGASANALRDFAVKFGKLMGEAEQLTLSTSFRSDTRILAGANAIAAKLATENVDVKKLNARKGAGTGRIVEARPLYKEQSYQAIARRIREVRDEAAADPARGEAEIAVLCRKRKYMDLVAGALRAEGIKYEIVGGESLVSRPEIVTIRAALAVAADPHRNDHLIRLCEHWAVGSDDLRALAEYARMLGRHEVQQWVEKLGKQPNDSVIDSREINLIEALFHASSQLGSVNTIQGLSREGRARFTMIMETINLIVSGIHLPVADLVTRAVTLLGLDVTAAVRGVGSQRVRTSIDSFISVARSFVRDHPGSSVIDFLEWLDAVEAKEHGGEDDSGEDSEIVEDVEVTPGIVQILTMHAAKGLEWRDLVVIPEVVSGEFSEKTNRFDLWLTKSTMFPFPLRHDYEYLPQFALSDFTETTSACEALDDLLNIGLPAFENQEIRRLAYVAVTRPTRELLLAGYAMPATTTKELEKAGSTIDPRQRSTFLEDMLTDPDTVITPLHQVTGSDFPEEWSMIWDQPVPTEMVAEYLAGETSSSIMWPQDLIHGVPVGEPRVSLEELECHVHAYLEQRGNTPETALERPYFTATEVVMMNRDPEAYKRQARRPIPTRPSRASRAGTELHAKIAASFTSVATLDIDAASDGALNRLDESYSDSVDELYEAFQATPWAARRIIAVEESVTVVIAGHAIRCTIDAVFDTSEIADLPDVMIVDWKSGRHPTAEELESRELQLAVYRIAWAKAYGIPLENIGACFVYLREPEERRYLNAGNLTEEEIAEKIHSGVAASGILAG